MSIRFVDFERAHLAIVGRFTLFTRVPALLDMKRRSRYLTTVISTMCTQQPSALPRCCLRRLAHFSCPFSCSLVFVVVQKLPCVQTLMREVFGDNSRLWMVTPRVLNELLMLYTLSMDDCTSPAALHFWLANGERMPLLAIIARIALVTPVVTTVVERTFGILGRFLLLFDIFGMHITILQVSPGITYTCRAHRCRSYRCD